LELEESQTRDLLDVWWRHVVMKMVMEIALAG
jgi:hypothetical protein